MGGRSVLAYCIRPCADVAVLEAIMLTRTSMMPSLVWADPEERVVFVRLHDGHLVDSATLARAKPICNSDVR
jgi:hypothetical protein